MSSRITENNIEIEINPLSEIIDDEVFDILVKEKVLHSKGIRDYLIRKLFKELRNKGMCVDDAVDEINQRYYPELQSDTIKKISYGILHPSVR